MALIIKLKLKLKLVNMLALIRRPWFSGLVTVYVKTKSVPAISMLLFFSHVLTQGSGTLVS